MGLLKRIYDWLLSLFWYVSLLAGDAAWACRKSDVWWPFTALATSRIAIMAMMVADDDANALQEHRDGHHDDWPPECWQDLVATSPGGESGDGPSSAVSYADIVVQGGEFTIEYV